MLRRQRTKDVEEVLDLVISRCQKRRRGALFALRYEAARRVAKRAPAVDQAKDCESQPRAASVLTQLGSQMLALMPPVMVVAMT